QWGDDAKDYALLSMAQTRATSKAMGNALRWVFKLAGYEGASSEEMDGVIAADKASPQTVSALQEAQSAEPVAGAAGCTAETAGHSASPAAQVNSGAAEVGTPAAPPE